MTSVPFDLAGVPAYADLPVFDNGLPHSWEVFADDLDLGTANFLTREVVLAASSEIRNGRRINISLPLTEPDPPFFGRGAPHHTIEQPVPHVFDDFIDNLYLQGSTQWDGLRHRRDAQHGFFGGLTEADAGSEGTRLGVDAWAQRGLVGRSVLVDVATHLADDPTYDPTGHFVITARLLADVLEAQGTQRRPGDILLVRTGFVDALMAGDMTERLRIRDGAASPGLSPGEDIAAYLWDTRCSAVAIDNPGVEVLPRDDSQPFLHARLIPMLGVPMGEFFTFGELAEASRADGCFSGFIVSVPLNLPGGVGSPANAVVIR